jgi:hypothetical protein
MTAAAAARRFVIFVGLGAVFILIALFLWIAANEGFDTMATPSVEGPGAGAAPTPTPQNNLLDLSADTGGVSTLAPINLQIYSVLGGGGGDGGSEGTSNFRYNPDNLDLTYHAVIPDETIYDIDMNYVRVEDPSGAVSLIARAPPQAPPFYYDLGAPKYNPASFVPTYEESQIMSYVRGTPSPGQTAGIPADQAVCVWGGGGAVGGVCYGRAPST